MKYLLQFTASAKEELSSLDFSVQKRIAKKIDFFLSTDNPIKYAESLTIPFLGKYRFRVGDYRIMFIIESSGVITILLVLNIKHRKDIYK